MPETSKLDPVRSKFSNAVTESHEARKNCVNGKMDQCKVADELWAEAVRLNLIINGFKSRTTPDDLFSPLSVASWFF